MKVRAMRLGYYNDKRRREGQEFFLKSEKDFSEIWMEKVSPKKKGKAPKQNEEPVKEETEGMVSNQEVI